MQQVKVRNYYRKTIDSLREKHRAMVQRVREEKIQVREAEKETKASQEAQRVIQIAAQMVQQEAHRQIGAMVSSCISSVFDENITLTIEFVQKRGKTEAVLFFSHQGVEADPLGSSSGGVLDVAAFAIRLADLVLSQPQRRRLLVLDEPFRGVAKKHLPRVAKMLETLSKDLGVQFIIATHEKELQVGSVVTFDS